MKEGTPIILTNEERAYFDSILNFNLFQMSILLLVEQTANNLSLAYVQALESIPRSEKLNSIYYRKMGSAFTELIIKLHDFREAQKVEYAQEIYG
jgi:hypothetical protein